MSIVPGTDWELAALGERDDVPLVGDLSAVTMFLATLG